ncbi:MAG: BatA domain-containing protein, partial [Planctomycetales bacterium]|nr:BatA domain-containing protein [Planctomycetales bacterium]
MSFLAPLYFLGALAVIGPIIFHLIRRQPKGEVEFSSLMFLESTPPRLTRRNRLENWPLLLLRCAAILLLAFAFARPFLPLAESDSVAGVKQAIVLLIDQSASMKRSGLFDQATNKANQILKEADGETLVSVIAFDSVPHTLLSLEESTTLISDARIGAAKDAVDRIRPTWQSTDLGKAIRYAADQAALLEVGTTNEAAQTPNNANASASIETRIVLLSDLQSGAAIETLQGYEWPERVWLDVETLAASTRGNVSLRVLPQPGSGEQADNQAEDIGDTVRVQVVQSEDGDTSTFRLRFDGEKKDAAVIQVPPGQTRFFNVKLPDPETKPDSETAPRMVSTATLNVLGDADDYDNAFHFIRPRRISQQVRLIESAPRELKNPAAGNTIDARDTLAFYASQIPWSDQTRNVECVISTNDEVLADLDPDKIPLLIFNGSTLLSEKTDLVAKFVAGGGRVLIVLDRPVDEVTRDAVATLLGSPELSISEASTDQSDESEFKLISSVDFRSPLIAPLADPGVNDFSNIRIWRHRRIAGLADDTSVTL